MIERTEIVKTKKTGKKAKWVSEQPPGLDPKVWKNLLRRLEKADSKLRLEEKGGVCCAYPSDVLHKRLFRAANTFAKLASSGVLPLELAQRLAAPGCGKHFWSNLTFVKDFMPAYYLKPGGEGELLVELVPGLLRDGEHEGVLSILNKVTIARSISLEDLASFVGELQKQGRNSEVGKLLARHVRTAEKCLEQSIGRDEKYRKSEEKAARGVEESALHLLQARLQCNGLVHVRRDGMGWYVLGRLARLDAKWADKPGPDPADRFCALVAPKDLGRFCDQFNAEPKALKAKAERGQLNLVCGYLHLVDPEGNALDEEEFPQSIELLAPLVPGLKAKGMDSEADQLEAELFKAIFRAHIHVEPATFDAAFKQAYPNASKTEVDCANFLFDALCKHGPGQVWKVEGLVHAFAMIPYKGIQQAFTLVAGNL